LPRSNRKVSDPFNVAMRDGGIEAKMKRILDQLKPEAVYLTAWNGSRCAFLLIELADPSQIPSFCEPWFLTFNADIYFYPL
jgi:hypothetical protein